MKIVLKWSWITLLAVISLSVKTFGQNTRSPFCKTDSVLCPSNLIPGGSCSCDYIDSTDCRNLQLHKPLSGAHLQYGSSELGDIKIEAYQYIGRVKIHPNVNISFSNIKWRNLTTKYTVKGTNITTCRTFTIDHMPANIQNSVVLFWDCHWFKSDYQIWPIEVEFQASAWDGIHAEYRKFSFQLPAKANIDLDKTKAEDWELLVYRETYDHGVTGVTIHWSRPPEKFGVTKFRAYLNELHQCRNPQLKDSTELIVGPNETEVTLSLKFDTCYNVSVQPWFEATGWGRVSYLQPFYISVSQEEIVIRILLVVASIVLFVSVLAYCCWHFIIIHGLKKLKLKTCLLVYEPASKEHLEVVKLFVLFLESLHIPVRFAERDLKIDDSLGDWWACEMGDDRQAEIVLAISTPNPTNLAVMMQASTHANFFLSGFVERQLSGLMSSRIKKPRFIRILLPYCSKSDFYKVLKGEPCHNVLKDRFKMLEDIMGPHNAYLPCAISRILYSPAFKTEAWNALETAIKKITDQTSVPKNLTDETLCNLMGDKSVSASDDDDNNLNDFQEQKNNKLLPKVDDQSLSDAVSSALPMISERIKDDYDASDSSLNESPFKECAKNDDSIDNNMENIWKFF